jgi:hypothetical protein
MKRNIKDGSTNDTGVLENKAPNQGSASFAKSTRFWEDVYPQKRAAPSFFH